MAKIRFVKNAPLRSRQFRANARDVVEVVYVDGRRGRVKFSYWTGPLRGDLAWLSLGDFKRLFPQPSHRPAPAYTHCPEHGLELENGRCYACDSGFGDELDRWDH